MAKELLAALKTCARDDAIRCVVITGASRGFSAGQDLAKFSQVSDDFSVADHLRHGYHRLVLAMRELEKPVIAAMNGVVAGAGLGLALAADMRIASAKASFVTAFISIGLTKRVLNKVTSMPLAQALEMVILSSLAFSLA